MKAMRLYRVSFLSWVSLFQLWHLYEAITEVGWLVVVWLADEQSPKPRLGLCIQI